jgi:alanine racemase
VNLRPTWAEIDLSAIESNFFALKSLLPENSFFCPMVKADGYGHGAIEVTKRLEKCGAKFVGVSLVEEGINLKQSGCKIEVLVFGTYYDVQSAEACVKWGLTPVVSSFPQLEALESVGTEIKVHLKFDTGMSRLGFSPSDAKKVRDSVEKLNWTIEGVCTHFSKGDDAGTAEGFSTKQIKLFEDVLKVFHGKKFYTHALNSSGIGAFYLQKIPLEYGGRPGIALYGPQPIPGRTNVPLKNVLTLKSKIVTSRTLRAGEAVSYNATWIAKRDSLIGILPIGYADGIPRYISNSFSVLCKGQFVPIVGIVCMDYLMLDLTDIKDQLESLGVGEEVVLIGRQGSNEITALEWAKILGTISYEILTRISSRVPRIYVST